jgi:hypothetical protein
MPPYPVSPLDGKEAIKHKTGKFKNCYKGKALMNENPKTR